MIATAASGLAHCKEDLVTRFGHRLFEAMRTYGPLCVGLDPHPSILESWGLPDSAEGLRTFSTITLEALEGRVAAVKPQVAFYERHGSAGMSVLEDVVGECRRRNLLNIMDAKRGDIGSTMAGYADAFLRDGGPFAGDALTVSPFLGVESLAETIETALSFNRGVFVLALTSNPEGHQVQHSTGASGVSVAGEIAEYAATWNDEVHPMGDVGLVVGATIADSAHRLGVDLTAVNGPLLAPGVGAQGGRVEDLPSTFGAALATVLVNSSREILRAGPDPQAISAAASDLSTRLGALDN